MKRIPLILLLLVAMQSCGHREVKPEENKEPVRIVVDLNKSYQGMEGGILWEWEPDTTNGLLRVKHLDTIIGIKNWNPIVLIYNGDTTYHYNDTIRIKCKPDTVTIYKNIEHANNVYIN